MTNAHHITAHGNEAVTVPLQAAPWTRLTWAEIANGGEDIHPNWSAAVTRAEAAGLAPGELTGVQFTGGPKHELPRLMFTNRMVTPVGVFVWCPEERGDGEPA